MNNTALANNYMLTNNLDANMVSTNTMGIRVTFVSHK